MQSVTNLHRQLQIQANPTCRICLQQSPTQSEPSQLISPCGCKGTAKYVHTECMTKWIKNSLQRSRPKTPRNSITCQMCKTPIEFKIGSESWCSWYESKPCSAVFYLVWIGVLVVSFLAVLAMVLYAVVTREFGVMRFLGLPLGVFVCGGFLFYYCGKDFRDYQKNIITIAQQDQRSRKTSTSSIKSQPQNQPNFIISPY